MRVGGKVALDGDRGGDGGTHDLLVLSKQGCVGGAEPPQELRRALDVGEQKVTVPVGSSLIASKLA